MRDYSYGTRKAHVIRPSMGALLAGATGKIDEIFRIDQSIKPTTIPRVSFASIINGTASMAKLSGKKLFAGATAIELGDRYAVPRNGVLPGVIIQAQVHRILTRRTYMGEHEFNKRTKTKELKPTDEVVTVPVPSIIDGETFDAVQILLKARNPKVTPARVVSGPTLLTGLIHCAKCGGAMTKLNAQRSIRNRNRVGLRSNARAHHVCERGSQVHGILSQVDIPRPGNRMSLKRPSRFNVIVCNGMT